VTLPIRVYDNGLKLFLQIPNKVGYSDMYTNWLYALMLFAQEGDAEKKAPPGLGDLFANPLILLFLLIFLFYFIVMRPQRKEQSRRLEMLANMKKNDRVVTIGGIYGVVMNVHREADEVTIRVDETTNTKLRMTIASIARVMSGDASEEESSK
jgi:preprotein translocase subunit YajC